MSFRRWLLILRILSVYGIKLMYHYINQWKSIRINTKRPNVITNLSSGLIVQTQRSSEYKGSHQGILNDFKGQNTSYVVSNWYLCWNIVTGFNILSLTVTSQYVVFPSFTTKHGIVFTIRCKRLPDFIGRITLVFLPVLTEQILDVQLFLATGSEML